MEIAVPFHLLKGCKYKPTCSQSRSVPDLVRVVWILFSKYKTKETGVKFSLRQSKYTIKTKDKDKFAKKTLFYKLTSTRCFPIFLDHKLSTKDKTGFGSYTPDPSWHPENVPDRGPVVGTTVRRITDRFVSSESTYKRVQEGVSPEMSLRWPWTPLYPIEIKGKSHCLTHRPVDTGPLFSETQVRDGDRCPG